MPFLKVILEKEINKSKKRNEKVKLRIKKGKEGKRKQNGRSTME